MDNIKPDQTFFTLRCWRNSFEEQILVKKIYSTNLLTPRERRTLAVYHSATNLHLHAYQNHYKSVLTQLESTIPDTEEQITMFLIELENKVAATIAIAWSVFDSLAHEINLVSWKIAGRKHLYHPYINEKKISFYMVREKLLASDKLKNSKLCQILEQETKDIKSRAKEYIQLSELARRSAHRPILLGHRLVKVSEGLPQIFLTDIEGMPADSASALTDFEIISGIAQIRKWLESFVDQVYMALSLSL